MTEPGYSGIGIAGKIALATSAVTLVGILLTGMILTSNAARTLRDVSLERLEHAASLTTRRLRSALDASRRDALLLANSGAIQALVTGAPSGTVRATELLETTLGKTSRYAAIRVVDLAAIRPSDYLGVVREQLNNAQLTNSTLLENPTPWDERRPSGLRAGDVYFSGLTGEPAGARMGPQTLQVITPVKSSISGNGLSEHPAVVLDINLGVVFAAMREKVPAGAALYVTNALGDYLVPTPRRQAGIAANHSRKVQDDIDGLEPLLNLQTDTVRLEKPAKNGNNGMAVSFDRVTLPGMTAGESSILVGITEPEKVIWKEVGELLTDSAWLVGILSLLAAAAGFALMRLLVEPLSEITAAVRGFEGDALTGTLPISRNDEIGVLGRHLDAMAQRIRTQFSELSEQTSRLNSIVETAADAIIVIDDTGMIERCNRAAENLFDYSTAELVGKNVSCLMNLADRVKHDEYIERYLRTGERNIIGTGREVTGRDKHGNDLALYLSIGEFSVEGQRKFTGILHDISERLRLERELLALAQTDPLTGTSNRRHFLESAQNELMRAWRYNHPAGLLVIDVDRFKSINDRFGHATGDAALQTVVGIIGQVLRDSDLLGRLGGDEFAVLLPESDVEASLMVAQRLTQLVSEATVVGMGKEGTLGVSIGVAAVNPEEQSDVLELIAEADTALYRAKEAGRGRAEAAAIAA